MSEALENYSQFNIIFYYRHGAIAPFYCLLPRYMGSIMVTKCPQVIDVSICAGICIAIINKSKYTQMKWKTLN